MNAKHELCRRLGEHLRSRTLQEVLPALPGGAPPAAARIAAALQVCLVVSGSRPFVCQGTSGPQRLELTPQNAVLLEPGAWYAPAVGVSCVYVGIHLHREYLRVHSTTHPDWEPGSGPDLWYATGRAPPPALFDLAAALIWLRPQAASQREQVLLCEGLLRLARRELAADRASASSRADRVYRDICDYLRENFRYAINRETAAFRFGLSPGYISHLFQERGRGFQEYLTALRLDHAKILLRNRRLLIRDVAEQCGFNDQRYFSTAFRKRVGMAPSRFRATL